jgi:hypothetical protein
MNKVVAAHRKGPVTLYRAPRACRATEPRCEAGLDPSGDDGYRAEATGNQRTARVAAIRHLHERHPAGAGISLI